MKSGSKANPLPNRPRVAISACLLGKPIRYNGNHRRHDWIADQLTRIIDPIAVCPEMEAGFGVPRPTIHLRRIGQQVRLVREHDPRVDVTDTLLTVAQTRARELAPLCGFVFKSRSPSCGPRGVALSDEQGRPLDNSQTGLFARRFAELQPLVPVCQESDLDDAETRTHFLQQVFALHHWYQWIGATRPISGNVITKPGSLPPRTTID